MTLSLIPAFGVNAFAEDSVTTTTVTAPSETTVSVDTDSKTISVDSDKLTADENGHETEQKETSVLADGRTDQTAVTDNEGNKANVISGTDNSSSTVVLDADGNPATTTVSSETTSKQESAVDDRTTTTTTTDTTVKTTTVTSVDQNAVDKAGKTSNIANEQHSVLSVKATVEGVTYEMFACDSNDNKLTSLSPDNGLDHFEIDYTIGTEAEGDQTIQISDGVLAVLQGNWDQFIESLAEKNYKRNGYASVEEAKADLYKRNGSSYRMEPGDTNNFVIKVIAADGVKHTYQYKNESLVLDTSDTEITKDNTSGATGYDGKEIPMNYVSALASSQPIQALFDVKQSNNVTLLNKLDIYNQLALKGYTKEKYENPLTAYILDYYNSNNSYMKKDGSAYTSMEQLLQECPKAVINMQSGSDNSIYTVTQAELDNFETNAAYKEILEGKNAKVSARTDGKYDIQLIWPENALAAASYDLFYNDLYEFSFGDEFINGKSWSKKVNSNLGSNYGLGDYAEKNGGLYSNANTYLNQSSELNNANGSNTLMSYIMRWGINGPLTTNSYQKYNFSFKSSLILEQIDGDLSVNKTDEAGDVIGSNEASAQTGFNLYYITNDTNGTKMYYAQDGNGNYYYTEDITKAALLMTEKGNLSVQYLLPNTYYLHEVIAPKGYCLNKTDLQMEIQSGKITKVNFTDIAPITTTTTQKETTITTTVSTKTLVTPIAPDTPNTPESPLVPAAPAAPERPAAPITTDTIEETMVDKSNNRPVTPHTGDQTNINLFAGILSLSVMCALAAVVLKKKYTNCYVMTKVK
jgi:hypothetical protein